MSGQPNAKEPEPDDVPLPEVPRPGAILADAYRVENVIGTGGMGVILRATQLAADRPVAIKLMTAATAADPEQVARFRREAKAASSLTSKHVVRVLDHGDLDSGLPYLVMEHLEGSSLSDVVKARGALPVKEAVDYVLQATHGVAEAHVLGIVHRDLKPANLFLTSPEGAHGAAVVKVLDFGASKLTPESTIDPSGPGGVTIASSLIGSPRYMAPEQIRTALEVDARADVYGLGATLHELLTAKPLFNGDTLAQIFAQVLWDPPEPLATTRGDVPKGLADVIAKCLAKAPGDRYATVEALADALAPFGPMGTDPAARPDGKVTSAKRAAVVLRATAKMPRMKMATVPPKRTMKLAAFALAARFAPAEGEGAPVAPTGTVRMARFAAPLAAPPPRSPWWSSRLLLVLAAVGLVACAIAIAIAIAVLLRRAPRHSSSVASPQATATAAATK